MDITNGAHSTRSMASSRPLVLYNFYWSLSRNLNGGLTPAGFRSGLYVPIMLVILAGIYRGFGTGGTFS